MLEMYGLRRGPGRADCYEARVSSQRPCQPLLRPQQGCKLRSIAIAVSVCLSVPVFCLFVRLYI